MQAVHSSGRQRGAVALVVTLLLFFAMALAAAYANRNLLVEERASAAQVRSTVAFEAAEAGLEWTIAMLNSGQPIDAACRPTAEAGATTFRERLLRYDSAAGQHLPRTWSPAEATPRPLQAACRRDAEGWTCSCPTSGAPALPSVDESTAAPLFSVQFAAMPRPGLLQLTGSGCSEQAAPCLADSTVPGDSSPRMQVVLALVGALRSRPVAPLTAAGDVDAGSAAIGLRNADAASAGWVVHAGGSVNAPLARIRTAPGGSPALAIAAGDAGLQALGAERLFVRHFGLDKAAWREQSGVRRIACSGDCAERLVQAAATARLIWVDGDLRLDTPLGLGTPERPLVVAATGAVTLGRDVSFNGLLYAQSLRWDDAAEGAALLRGAAIVERDYVGNGAADFVYDAAILARLQRESGSFVRLPGSWRDF